MGILDSIVEWIATQVMNLLDLITGSVLGALGCDMSTFLRYFPAAETLYEIFVAIGVGFILLNLVWQLFRNFGLGLGLSAEDPVKLAIKSILFIFLALFADQIMEALLTANKDKLYSFAFTDEEREIPPEQGAEDSGETIHETIRIYTISYNGEAYFADQVFHLSDDQKLLASQYAQNLTVLLGDGIYQGLSETEFSAMDLPLEITR